MKNLPENFSNDAWGSRTCDNVVRPANRRILLLCVVMLCVVGLLSGCGGGSHTAQSAGSLSGNWQFTVANPSDNSSLGGLQGGFLLQKNGSVTGGAVYSVSLPAKSGGNPTVCNSGSAPITGTVNGTSVTLTAVAGVQTYTLTGTLSTNGTSMAGTYSATDGGGCGTAQSGLQWSAALVPSVTGPIQGSFHSTGGGAGLGDQNFPVSGTLTQGENIGASNATVTGTLSFIDPTTSLSNYPCFETASVNGQISGASIILQIIGPDGSNLGQIGGSTGSGISGVTVNSTSAGQVMRSSVPPAYAVNSKACPGPSLSNAGDAGNICLAIGGGSACQQPITLSPSVITFLSQPLGTTTSQQITLTNNDPSGATLSGLQLQFAVNDGPFGGPSDFNGLPNFVEADTCAPSLETSFSLAPSQSCSITISFTPQQSCAWLPFGNPPSIFGVSPAHCPFPLSATVTVSGAPSLDSNTSFAVPVTGIGASAITPSTGELDFGAEAVGETSPSQLVSFTNNSANPVQILSGAPCLNHPAGSGHNTLPHPLQDTSPVAGLQVVANGIGSVGGNMYAFGPTINYSCDSDPNTLLPNFQISSDTCTGRLLASLDTCSLLVSYLPQPATNLNSGLDYFLQLNTLQCSSTDSVSANCEIDAGRFPVELIANPPSPLRMSPSAGLDFGNQAVGQLSSAQAITLFNDPADPHSATVNFIGRIAAKGDYSETDDCPFNLPPGGSCTVTVTFKPKVTGFDPGSLTINVTPEPTGAPQTVQLRGTGQ